jgi:hypothetical protein
MKTIYISIIISVCFAFAKASSVDSVCVDSVWNSDSSWYDSTGVLHQRTARDCRISFIPLGLTIASCSLVVSLDSGKTWGATPNPLQILNNNSLGKPIPCGTKAYVTARVLGIDRPNVVFKVLARICDPITVASPIAGQKILIGDTLIVSWDKSVPIPKLSYNYNRGAGWQVFASFVSIGNNSAKIVLPTTSATDSFQIKIEDNSGYYYAGTTGLFSLKAIIISNPIPNQTFAVGQTVSIIWRDAVSKISSLRLMLSTDGGVTFGDMLTMSIPATTNSFSWIVGSEPGSGSPFSYPSSKCIIKLMDYTNSNLKDVSGTFTVQ